MTNILNFKEFKEINESFDIDAVIEEMKTIHIEIEKNHKTKRNTYEIKYFIW